MSFQASLNLLAMYLVLLRAKHCGWTGSGLSLKHRFKCSGNICLITPLKYLYLCKVISPFFPCLGRCLTFTNRKLSLSPSCLISVSPIFLSSFTGCILLSMTSIPPTFLLPPPPSYIACKYFPFSFQWKIMLIKRCTKSSAV